MREALAGVQRNYVLAHQARLLAVGSGKQQSVAEKNETNNCSTNTNICLEQSPTGSHDAAFGR